MSQVEPSFYQFKKTDVDFRSILTEAFYIRIASVINRLILSTQDNYPIGQIIYSAIDKTTFDASTSGTWALCNGGSIAGTDLQVTYGITNAPDLRGCFVRTLSLGSSIDTGRSPLSFQDSLNKGHQHFQINSQESNDTLSQMSDSAPFMGTRAFATGASPATIYIAGSSSNANSGRKVSAFSGISEARPANFQVNAYIKVSY
jgi:hypothetical protein